MQNFIVLLALIGVGVEYLCCMLNKELKKITHNIYF
jgi:hypothetical protein